MEPTLTSDEFLDWMCIGMRREAEDLKSATYRFTTERYVDDTSTGPVSGTLSIDKQTGAIKLVVPMPGDDEKRVFIRAAQKIGRHWAQGNLPETTTYVAG
ncbi:hypothetical protein [Ralstonia solanacearum]|uniref:Uncharacterized protein n=1 Tax=Ralstonia solanacearum TaxID=305 RepID=A0AAE3T4Y2_RALSL|nr:hypothetical protein [Ralstonia solanacearum]MBB6583781.1 hypothetical protein [Ralstonia solanacearum]MDB0521789.1 hypothetical protein [Ralstonia solanacearum]